MRGLWLILGLLLAVIPAMAQGDVGEVEFGGIDRSYAIYVPDDVDTEAGAPLVIMLHGAGMTGVDMMLFSQFNDLAELTGSIVVYPNGIQQGWTYLDREELHPADIYTDDLGFLETLMDHLAETYSIDSERVYLAGYSNGGLLTIRAACELADRLAGAAVIAANYSFALAEHCLDADTIPLVMVLGTRDQAFPWSGSAIATADGRLRSVFSVAQTMAFLSTHYACDLSASQPAARIETEDSPVAVIRERYTACDGGPIALYALVDFGHTWPAQPLVTLDSGRSGSIPMAIWEFFGLMGE